jgi:zinc protease
MHDLIRVWQFPRKKLQSNIIVNNMKLRKLFVAVALLTAGFASAQQMPEIPVDKDVRIGKLDNGLTYYLRHNNTPEKKANFYIA